MTGLVLLAGLLLAAVLALLSAPLLRPAPPPAARGAYDGAVYRDQLAELERDIARGLLSPAEAEPARLEIARRLLAADAAPKGPERLSPRLPWVALAVALAVAGGSIGVYLRLGAPGVPGAPFALRAGKMGAGSAGAAEHPDMARLAQALGERLKNAPNDANGWLLYARTLASLNDWSGAADAYRHRVGLGGADAATWAGYGEMQVLAARGTLAPEARAAFAEALRQDPSNPVARYYQAEGLLQAGDPAGALEAWRRLAGEVSDPEMRAQIGRRITAAAGMAGRPDPGLPPVPGQEQALTAGREMAARLAARLADAPEDFAGWMQLGRSYAVLGEAARAGEAFARAAALRPDDPAPALAGAEALLEAGPPLPPAAHELLARAARLAPESPQVLWLQGLEAAETGDRDAARARWQRLLATLPAEAPERAAVTRALEALDGKGQDGE